MGDIAWATLSIRNARTAGSVAQPAPDRPFSNDNGAGTPPQLSPSGGVFPVGGPSLQPDHEDRMPKPTTREAAMAAFAKSWRRE